MKNAISAGVVGLSLLLGGCEKETPPQIQPSQVQAPQEDQNSYTSKLGYTIGVNPKKEGMKELSEIHILEGKVVFTESFYHKNQAVFIQRNIKTANSLRDDFEHLSSTTSMVITYQLKPGQRHQLIGKGVQDIEIDGRPAIRGGLEFVLSNTNEGKELGRSMIDLSVMHYDDSMYIFTLMSMDTKDPNYEKASQVYKTVIDTFKREK